MGSPTCDRNSLLVFPSCPQKNIQDILTLRDSLALEGTGREGPEVAVVLLRGRGRRLLNSKSGSQKIALYLL